MGVHLLNSSVQHVRVLHTSNLFKPKTLSSSRRLGEPEASTMRLVLSCAMCGKIMVTTSFTVYQGLKESFCLRRNHTEQEHDGTSLHKAKDCQRSLSAGSCQTPSQ